MLVCTYYKRFCDFSAESVNIYIALLIQSLFSNHFKGHRFLYFLSSDVNENEDEDDTYEDNKDEDETEENEEDKDDEDEDDEEDEDDGDEDEGDEGEEDEDDKDEDDKVGNDEYDDYHEYYEGEDKKADDDKDDVDLVKDKDDNDKDGDLNFDKEAVEVVANANTNFGNALFKILAKGEFSKDNLIMSSFSVSTVLNMLLNGAKGMTAFQLKKGLTLKQELKRWVGNSDVVKNGFKDALTLLKTNENFTLNAANRIYHHVSYAFDKSYLQSTLEYFLAEPIGMNFSQAEKSRTAINQWVEGKTNKKIQDLIAPGDIDEDTRLVLVNAIYFKGDWQFKFDKSKTRKRDFHVSPTQTVQTDMMKSSGRYRVLWRIKDLKGADALDLPYKGKRLSMIILLPGKQGPTCHDIFCRPSASEEDLEDLEEAMSKVADLNSILVFERESNVDVTLPRFKLESELDLKEPLKQLGMTDMFKKIKADFSGMTGGTKNPLFVSKIKQKAFIEVNEEGAEAAAATFVAVSLFKSVSGIPEFRCDRPFVFLIRDNLTGMILFSGHVTDPSK